MINSGQLMTIKDACEATSINYSTIRTQIMRCKKNGKDFHKLVDEHVIDKLRNARPEVYSSLQERAISGSGFHQKLFSELVGDRVEKQQIDHNIGLIYAFVPMQTPPDLIRIREEEKVTKKAIETTATKIK